MTSREFSVQMIPDSAVGAWIFGSILSLFVEFILLWRLSPTVSEDICVSFRHELNDLYNEYSLSRDKSSTMPPPKEERIVWEYTTRDFLSKTRFDSVLGANRFSALMQCIQSGDASSWRKNGMRTA